MYATGRQVRDERGDLLGWADLGTARAVIILRQVPGKTRFVLPSKHPSGRPEFEEINIQSELFLDHGLMRRVWVATFENRAIIESLSCFQPVRGAG